MIESTELRVLHINEAELAKNIRSILQRVETGAQVIIERDTQLDCRASLRCSYALEDECLKPL